MMNLEEIKQRPGWEQLSAVQHDRICTGLNQDVIFRPGPRIIEGIGEFFQCLYPGYELPVDRQK